MYENDFYPYMCHECDAREAEPAQVKKFFMLTKKGLAVLIAACVAISGIFGIGGAYITGKVLEGSMLYPLKESTYAIPMNVDLAAEAGSKLSIQQVIDVAADAVVEINTETLMNDMWLRQFMRPGAGSGVIITPDGYIMTNNHVIEKSSKISVTLRNGERYDATVVGYDERTDVAVIKINAKGLTPVIFGDSDTILMGDLAVAIGNPLGELGGTATAGIISSLDRQITIEGKTMNLLQTDAAINRGNSGGGLFNQYGELIGLVVAKTEGTGIEGLNFAIPVNTVKAVASQLMEKGYVTGRPQIGIEMINLTSAQDAIRYGARNLGVYVNKVISDGAKKAGFQEGDMLYYLEDIRIEKPSDLTDGLMKYKVGDKVKVTVVRGNEIVDLTVELSEQKPNQ